MRTLTLPLAGPRPEQFVLDLEWCGLPSVPEWIVDRPTLGETRAPVGIVLQTVSLVL